MSSPQRKARDVPELMSSVIRGIRNTIIATLITYYEYTAGL